MPTRILFITVQKAPAIARDAKVVTAFPALAPEMPTIREPERQFVETARKKRAGL